MRVLILMLLATAALAGCASPPAKDAATVAATESAQNATALPPRWTGTFSTVAMVDAPCGKDHPCSNAAQVSFPRYEAPNATVMANLTTLHVRVSWNGTVASGVTFNLREESSGKTAITGAGPTSPILLEKPANTLHHGTDYLFDAQPTNAGAFVMQDVVAEIWYT